MAKNFNNKTFQSQPNKQNILYGRHAVLSAMANPKRQINKILCTKENVEEIRKVSKVVPQVVEKKEIDKLFANDAVHQGFALFCNHMGCGFGACMGCSCKTIYGNKRICKDGPVLRKEEILWQK